MLKTLIFNMDYMNYFLTIVSIFLGFFSVFEYLQKKKVEKALKSITWDDMRSASVIISKKLIKEYHPDVIYIPNIKSGIMMQFIRNYFKEYIPVVIGQTVSKDYFNKQDCDKIKGLDNYWYAETNKWFVYIPKILLEYKDQNILILDNISLTGNFLNIVTKELIKYGIPEDHIETACIATSQSAINDAVAPKYYYKTLEDTKIVYMPWGH